jgi:PAS domain S-box-containing protein
MRLNVSLTHKVLLFVTLPLLIQLALIGALVHLQQQSEASLREATHAQDINNKIHEITSDIFAIVSRYRTYELLDKTPLDNDVAKKMFGDLWKHYRELEVMAKDQPEIIAAVIASEQATNQSLEMFKSIKEAYDRADPETTRERILIARKYRHRGQDQVVRQLIVIADEQRKVFERVPEEQIKFRQKAQAILIVLGIFDLVLGIALALFLTKGITSRLHRVSDNTVRLAMGKPLLPKLEGKDEIALLDQVFHRMADDITEASRKERAVIHNARDFICTLDGNNRIVTANPASISLLGVEPDELVGKYVREIIAEDAAARAETYLAQLRTESDALPVELDLLHKNGKRIHTEWSAHWSDVEGSTFCVIHNVSERKRTERLKQEVTAMITHDLRSPLNTVNNVFDFFERLLPKESEERVHKYMLMGRRNTDRMLSLINDLLDIEKIKSGNMNIEIKPLEVDVCFNKLEESIATAADEAGIKLEVQEADAIVLADEKLIDRVLTNLVGNAIRYTPKGKRISLSCLDNGDGYAEIRVNNEGPEIAASELETVFERFRQLKDGKTKGGSGLGLTICKAIVEMHGGKIWAESGAEQGTSFVFTLRQEKNLL